MTPPPPLHIIHPINTHTKDHTMSQVTIQFDKDTGKYHCNINGHRFKTKNQSYIELQYQQLTGTRKSYREIVCDQAPKTAERFGINKRFTFVEKLVEMVASGVQASAVITGNGGLGKSYTVMKTLTKAGYRDISEFSDFEVDEVIRREKVFTQVKGYSTAKGLYRTLFENNGGVIVFDDCDSALTDATSLNILKGALDSYGKRIISWNADLRDPDLPRSFCFTGKIIFISNMNQDRVDQAIRSRSIMIDLSMDDDQKIERMQHILKSAEFMPEFSTAYKTEALNFIREFKSKAREISLRTLIQVTKIRATAGDMWKEMAEYTICN